MRQEIAQVSLHCINNVCVLDASTNSIKFSTCDNITKKKTINCFLVLNFKNGLFVLICSLVDALLPSK